MSKINLVMEYYLDKMEDGCKKIFQFAESPIVFMLSRNNILSLK